MYNDRELDSRIETGILGSYLWMGIGLLITFGIMYASLFNMQLVQISVTLNRFAFLIIIAIALLMRFVVAKASAMVLRLVFIAYSSFLGILLIPIMYAYETASILTILGGSAAMFIGMSAYGYFTQNNLQGYSKYLFGGVLGIIVMSLLNIFLFRNNMVEIVISILGLVIFIIYTAVDTQRIKSMLLEAHYQGDIELMDKVQIFGALMLYLDFINIFLYLLSLFGKRRN